MNTLFNGLANHPDFNTVDWKNLRVSVGGGMAVQGAVAKLWLEKTGCPICEGYGLSETSPVRQLQPGRRPRNSPAPSARRCPAPS